MRQGPLLFSFVCLSIGLATGGCSFLFSAEDSAPAGPGGAQNGLLIAAARQPARLLAWEWSSIGWVEQERHVKAELDCVATWLQVLANPNGEQRALLVANNGIGCPQLLFYGCESQCETNPWVEAPLPSPPDVSANLTRGFAGAFDQNGAPILAYHNDANNLAVAEGLMPATRTPIEQPAVWVDLAEQNGQLLLGYHTSGNFDTWLWDPTGDEFVQSRPRGTGYAGAHRNFGIAWSANQPRALSLSTNQLLLLEDATSGDPFAQHLFDVTPEWDHLDLAFSPDGTRAAIALHAVVGEQANESAVALLSWRVGDGAFELTPAFAVQRSSTASPLDIAWLDNDVAVVLHAASPGNPANAIGWHYLGDSGWEVRTPLLLPAQGPWFLTAARGGDGVAAGAVAGDGALFAPTFDGTDWDGLQTEMAVVADAPHGGVSIVFS